MKRIVIITVDDLLRIFIDYLGEDILPGDAKPVKLMKNTQEQGLLGLVVESNAWKGDQGSVRVDFQLKRIYTV